MAAFSCWVACALRETSQREPNSEREREREKGSLQTALPGNRNLRTWLGVAWRWEGCRTFASAKPGNRLQWTPDAKHFVGPMDLVRSDWVPLRTPYL